MTSSFGGRLLHRESKEFKGNYMETRGEQKTNETATGVDSTKGANPLLKLIETVDPSDTAKMDEIDKAVEQYLQQKTLKFEDIERYRDDEAGFIWFEYERLGNIVVDDPENPIRVQGTAYTRSRDALKAIRPEGAFFRIESDGLVEFRPKEYKGGFLMEARAATEELAELHAILQAISHDRNQ